LSDLSDEQLTDCYRIKHRK